MPRSFAQSALALAFVVAVAGCSGLRGPAPSVPTAATVQVDGRPVSYLFAGRGEPLVVFEAGLGKGKEVWREVLPSVMGEARVLAYDRPGYGGTPDDGGSRDAPTTAASLVALLEALELEGPYILVGHALGATYVEFFTRNRPDEVEGVVLIDPRLSEFSTLCAERVSPAECGEGLASLRLGAVLEGAAQQEWLAKREIDAGTRESPPWPAVPITVISATLPELWGSAAAREVWLETHAELAGTSPHGAHVEAETGHFVHRELPELVAASVLDVVALARRPAEPEAGDGGTSR